VLVQHQAAQLGMTNWLNAEEVVHFAFESTGAVAQVGDRRKLRVAGVE
jgi:hypothetical protein